MTEIVSGLSTENVKSGSEKVNSNEDVKKYLTRQNALRQSMDNDEFPIPLYENYDSIEVSDDNGNPQPQGKTKTGEDNNKNPVVSEMTEKVETEGKHLQFF